MQDVPARAGEDAAAALRPIQIADMGAQACDNPCNPIPYRVRSAAEQDVARTYQSITKSYRRP